MHMIRQPVSAANASASGSQQRAHASALDKDLTIAVMSNILPRLGLYSHLTLNSGTTREALPGSHATARHEACYFPKPDWRPLTAEELDLVVTNVGHLASSSTKSMLFFTIPDQLYSRFWDLDLAKLLPHANPADPEYSSAYRAFTADIITYLVNELGFSISGQCACTTTINKPGLRSTRYNPQLDLYTGLDVDDVKGMGPDTGHLAPTTASINMGDEVSHLSFINLRLARMVERLKLQEELIPAGIPASISASAKLFMQTFPAYPAVRIGIMPGQGYLLPTDPIIYDRDTMGKTGPDITLSIQAVFALRR